jgi:hypothetical protein
MVISRSLEPILSVNNLNVKIDGLQFKTTSVIGVAYGVGCNGATLLSNSIIIGAGDASYKYFGIYPGDAEDQTDNIFNCVVYNLGGNGNSSAIYVSSGIVNIYSSTLVGQTNTCGVHRVGGTVACKNCYAAGDVGDAYLGTITKTTCASSDTTGSTGLQSIAVNTTNFTNVTEGSENFDLPLGSALIDVGTDTSGDAAPLNFTTDIVARTRGATWDIGAFEYVAAGGANWLKERYWWSYPYNA